MSAVDPSPIVIRWAALLLSVLLGACATPGQQPNSAAGVEADSTLPGVETFVPVAHISRVPFLVIEVEAQSASEDNFDYWLRDALVAAGFPNGMTRAQLARRMIEAGMGDSARFTTDPLALRQFARVAGPFLRLRVEYDVGGWGYTQYRVELWDVNSAELVYAGTGKKLIVWKLAEEMGPQIVAGLKKWREASLLVEREAEAGRSAT